MSDDIIRPKIDLRQQTTIKCEKCEKIFFIGGQGDKCPECGYSKSEERRKEYKAKKKKK